MLHKLAKTFTRKGELRDNRMRMMITYEQVMNDNNSVYLFRITYDGAVHYTAFIADFYEHGDDIFELFADERSYATGRAINKMTYEDALIAYQELVEQNNMLFI